MDISKFPDVLNIKMEEDSEEIIEKAYKTLKLITLILQAINIVLQIVLLII